MRSLGLVVLITGCSFTPGRFTNAGDDAGGGGGGDSDTRVWAEDVWMFDSAAELGATGHATESLTIEPGGTLTPAGYIYGGLLMRGKQSMQLWNVSSTTFDYAAAAALTPDGTTLWDTQDTSTADSLEHAGVTSNTQFTIWFEGEVYLDANDIVSISGDGAVFVDLLMPSGWVQLVSKTDGFHEAPAVTTAGWYPVRLGWGEGSSLGFIDFRRGPSGAAVHYSRDRLRASVSSLRGTMRHVFYRQIFGGAATNNGFPIASHQATPLLPATDLATTPLGSGGTNVNDWSARWYGQFYAAVAGQYELTANTDDGNQVRLAAAVGGSDWTRGSGNGSAVGTAMADLAIGWHDVVFDYNSVGGARAAAVQITMSPDPALVGAPIPLERLRPVEPRRDRLLTETRKFAPVSIPNNAAGPIRTITFEGFPNEIVTALDVTFGLSTTDLGQLQFFVQRPGGVSTLVADPSGGTQLNNGHFYVHVTNPAVIGQAVGGTWSFQVSDSTGSSNTSSLDEVLVTIHTSGGPPAIAETSSWISPVRDVGAAPVEVTTVTWNERAAIPSELFLRACANPDCSDNPAWGAAIPTEGTAILDTQYIQAKVVMHSDGTTEPELDSLAISYRY